MARERPLQPSGDLERPFPALPQEVHQHIQHPQDDPVPCRGRNRVVKLGVLVDGEFPVLDFVVLAEEDLLQPSQFVARGMHRRAGRERRLDHLTDIQQVGEQGAVADQQRGEGVHQRVGAEVPDDRALPLPGFEQSHQFQDPDGVSD